MRNGKKIGVGLRKTCTPAMQALLDKVYNPTFNPMDKIIELYEKRLQEKDNEIALLKNLLEK